MEVVPNRRIMEAVQGAQDFISNMPDIVITNILDRLPLQDAVRTDILSRNWRLKWAMLSEPIFDMKFFAYLRKTTGTNNHVRVIDSILLRLRGAITKCVLLVDDESDVEDEHIIQWISVLSRKGINDLTLEYYNKTSLKLPTHLFSCLELKHLKFFNCSFNPPPTFYGFQNLLSLEFSFGRENTKLGELITLCPLLEILKLDVSFSNRVKLDEVAKLENLKILSLSLCNLDTTMKYNSSDTIIELLGSLPKLQELELDFVGCKLIQSIANKRFSITFPRLKALKLSRICLDNGMKLSCAFELIRSCPNLRTLEITSDDERVATSPPQVDYNTTGLLQLRSVMFEYRTSSKNAVCLIKYLLASSPFLKKVVIRPYSSPGFVISLDEKFTFAMKLLKLHRASPVAEIDFIRF